MGEELTLLLQKELTDTLTPAERERLDYILQEWPPGHAIAKATRNIWEKTALYNYPDVPNTEEDFGRLLSAIHAATPPMAQPVRTIPFMWWKAAAALVLLLAAGVVGWHRWQANDPVAQITQVNIQTTPLLCQLPDSSSVWLHSGATLQYDSLPEIWSERVVHLTGTAFFKVTRRPENPFRVEMEDKTSVEVLGTSFLVSADAQDKNITILVEEGKVRFMAYPNHSGQVIQEGQRAVFDKKSSRIHVSKPPTLNELAWQRGGLSFVNTPLAQVCADIERYYKVKIELKNAALRQCSYTAPLNGASLEKVLNDLGWAFQLNVRQEKDGNLIILEGGNCPHK
jgi:ferric-dicitrate binding protein FerR (iron transport regulator)